jgi:hypothetical protein
MRRVGTLVVLAAVGAATGAPRDETELDRLREPARQALKASCGRCHDHARPTARPGALRIFDLREQDWSARVTDVQMDHIVARFDGFQMPPGDQAAVRKFLDAERARRAASLPPPADDVQGP